MHWLRVSHGAVVVQHGFPAKPHTSAEMPEPASIGAEGGTGSGSSGDVLDRHPDAHSTETTAMRKNARAVTRPA